MIMTGSSSARQLAQQPTIKGSNHYARDEVRDEVMLPLIYG